MCALERAQSAALSKEKGDEEPTPLVHLQCSDAGEIFANKKLSRLAATP